MQFTLNANRPIYKNEKKTCDKVEINAPEKLISWNS